MSQQRQARNIEDWRVYGGTSAYTPRGAKIVIEESVRLMEPEELVVWEILHQTIVDCHKVATGQWRHFKCMWWHKEKEPERILSTAREYIKGWIESDAFSDYLHLFGWNPEKALVGIREVYEGKRVDEVEALLRQIAKQRDARRNREENLDERES